MMNRIAFLIACVFLPFWATCSAAQDGTESDRPVQVVIARQADGVVVRYDLPTPVRSFSFADRDTIRDLWTVTTPGLTFADNTVMGTLLFDQFEIHISPDAAEVDRIYVGLSRVGEGRVVYGPGLKSAVGDTVLSFELAEGETGIPEQGSVDGYAYIGPSAQVTKNDRGSVVFGANVSLELSEPLDRSFSESLAFYEIHLGAQLPYRPTLIASVDSPGPASFRGDVTDTGVISVRFQGDAWRGATDQVIPFVWHETFHLWNGHGVKARDEEAAPWLHEGGAEYAATVGAVSTGGLTEAQARESLSRRIVGCRRVLGNRDFDSARLRSGGGPYDCGVLIQWLADLELRKAMVGDVFSLWKTLLDAARDNPLGYGVDDFRARLVPDSAVAVLLDGPGQTRWATIRERLADLGVTIENRPGDEDLMTAALFHVARINCKTGDYGFFNAPGALKLDGANCGPLSGEPIIEAIEGFDPQAEGRAMFDAVQARCAESLPIRYRARDGRVIEAVCDVPLSTPEVWWVAEAPNLRISTQPSRLL